MEYVIEGRDWSDYDQRWGRWEVYGHRSTRREAQAEARTYKQHNRQMRVREVAWGRNPAKKRKSSPSKRISSALSRFLKRQNPAFRRASGVRVQKLKGGVIKLTPM